MSTDLKQAFIRKALDDYMRAVVEAMRREIIRRNVLGKETRTDL